MRSPSLRHLLADGAVPEPGALRALAAWYREYAEGTGLLWLAAQIFGDVTPYIGLMNFRFLPNH